MKITAGVLLAFNGTGALYGGSQLIRYPDGSSLQLSPDLLTHTFFNSYLIPGLILFVANGLMSLYALATLVFRSKHHGSIIMLQGMILTGWIVVQVLLIQTLSFWHFLLALVGLNLILLGNRLQKWQRIKD